MNLSVLIAVITVTLVFVFLTQQTIIFNQTLGKQSNPNLTPDSNSFKISILQTADAKTSLLNNSITL